jgi:hypothetical protein
MNRCKHYYVHRLLANTIIPLAGVYKETCLAASMANDDVSVRRNICQLSVTPSGLSNMRTARFAFSDNRVETCEIVTILFRLEDQILNLIGMGALNSKNSQVSVKWHGKLHYSMSP